MARKSSRTAPSADRPFWRHPLVLPAVFAVVALLFLVSGDGALAFAFLLGALGAALYTVGKVRRWKGAPEAGLLVAGISAVMALWALFG